MSLTNLVAQGSICPSTWFSNVSQSWKDLVRDLSGDFDPLRFGDILHVEDIRVLIVELQCVDARGIELILCKTCLGYSGLGTKVEAGVVGGMPDIIEL